MTVTTNTAPRIGRQPLPKQIVYAAPVGVAAVLLRQLRLASERNRWNPVVEISIRRICELASCCERTAERASDDLHARGLVKYTPPLWVPDSAYESVHHMPGRYELTGGAVQLSRRRRWHA